MKILLAAVVAILMGQGYAGAEPPVAAKSLIGQLPALDGSLLTNVQLGNTIISSMTFKQAVLIKGLTTGTSAQFNNTLTANALIGNGAGVTDLTAGNITAGGTLPAVDGSALTNLPGDATKLPLAGGSLDNNASLTLSGATGIITTESSVTASAFFGDGSALTNLPGEDRKSVV